MLDTEQSEAGGRFDLVDFRMFERLPDGSIYEGIYGISVAKVREILVQPEMSKVPDAHPALAGIFHLRGSQVAAIDLAQWLRMDPAPPEGLTSKIIVFELGEETMGLIVHQTSRIRSVAWADVEPPSPLIRSRHGNTITGTTLIDGEQTLLLVDVEQIVGEMSGGTGGEGDTPPPPPAESAAPGGAPTILAVDDALVARSRLNRTLTAAGYHVLEAGDGQQALQFLREQVDAPADRRVQLVITDAEMPRLNGFDFIRALRADDRLAQLPVIMLTSLSGEANERRGLEAGCDEYQIKFDASRLIEAVQRLLS